MKIKALFASSIMITLFFLMSSCANSGGFDECHNSIYLTNNSDKTIYYVSTLKENFFNFDPTNPTYATDLKIKPGEKMKVRIGFQLSCWEQVLDNAGGYVYIYIYDAEYLESTDWQSAKNNYIKKYKLDTNQLKKSNWSVVYS
ncbi:MAG: hypothetical protein VB024_02670 [Dysgonamonadaceae bacterium]|nr:hypothetical protein [Dysgonamonadaceae bacterium]MDD4398956.1 hypothetical protein [Dysgonamonadaceae bacterium]MEA5080509.1 hypothetical protein [Dysgonamonadaceae bacterium]